MQYFDQVYVLNRKVDTKRREHIESQFAKHNITNYTIFDAVDKDTFTKEDLCEKQILAYPGNTFHCKNNQRCSCSGNGHELSAGNIGCSWSHYKMYRDIQANKYERALIFEDDATLHPNFSKLMSELVEQLKQLDWELVYFGRNNPSEATNNNSLTRCFSGFSGTHMYAITGLTAARIAEAFFPIRAAADGFLDRFCIQAGLITKAYFSNIKLASNDSFDVSSGIESLL
jgi:GR25 family glycosyltransferase involved in LPS biosynthesis